MDTLIWKAARIVGHPDGDIWAVVSVDHFDNPAGGLDTVAVAAALMRQPLPDGGLVTEYLFLEELERAALAAEVTAKQAQRNFLRCSVLSLTHTAAHARIEAARHRFVSDTMASLERLRKAQNGSTFGPGEAYLAIRLAQQQHADDAESVTLIIPWEISHDD